MCSGCCSWHDFDLLYLELSGCTTCVWWLMPELCILPL